MTMGPRAVHVGWARWRPEEATEPGACTKAGWEKEEQFASHSEEMRSGMSCMWCDESAGIQPARGGEHHEMLWPVEENSNAGTSSTTWCFCTQ